MEAMQAGATLYVTKSEATLSCWSGSCAMPSNANGWRRSWSAWPCSPGEDETRSCAFPPKVTALCKRSQPVDAELLVRRMSRRCRKNFSMHQQPPWKWGPHRARYDCAGRTFSFVIAPIAVQGYVNLYGRDITERKRAEGALHQANETLQEQAEQLEVQAEELQAQTEELAKTNERLYQSGQIAQHSLAELHSIYAAAPVGCASSTDLRYRAINDRLAKVNGLPAASHIGRTLRGVSWSLPMQWSRSFGRCWRQASRCWNRRSEGSASLAGRMDDWLVSCHPVRRRMAACLG